MSTERHLVIVGTGIAGCTAALGARAADAGVRITLIGAEPHIPYDRTHLSKQQLASGANWADSALLPADQFERERITLRSGTRVIGIDPEAQTLTLSGDETLPYDALILATGSVARPLPDSWEALPAARVHYIRVAEDSNRLRAALADARRLVIIGAGLIGLEVAAAARAREIEVAVVDTASRVLMRSCDEATADCVARMHQERGVTLHLRVSITGVRTTPGGDPELTLSDGTVLTADHLVAGIGVLPDTALAEAAGLEVNNGILVDAYGQTSHPGIYATGDVASLPLGDNTHPVRLETWRHAQDHGRQVGANAVGLNQVYDQPPSFWSDQYDHRIQGVGLITDDVIDTVVRDYNNGAQLSFLLGSDQTLRAVVGFDCGKEVNAAGRLVGRPIPVSATELADPSQPLTPLVKSLLKSAG